MKNLLFFLVAFTGVTGHFCFGKSTKLMAKSGLNLPKDTTVSAPQQSRAVHLQVLQITEVDEDGKRILLKPNYVVVDPNSKLEVLIDTAEIKAQSNATLSPDISNRMATLKEMLVAEKESINNLSKAVDAFKSGQPKSVWIPLLQGQNKIVNLILRDPEGRSIYKSLPLSPDIEIQYKNLFITAGKMLANLQERLLTEVKAKGVYVQLGAWLESKQGSIPIHIPGYDDYTAQAPTSVERFQVVLTAEQQAQLTAIKQLASTANRDGLPAAIKTVKVNIGQIIAGLDNLPSVKTAMGIYQQLEILKSKTSAELGTLKPVIQEADDAMDVYLKLIQSFVDKYQNPVQTTDANQLLSQINADIQSLVQETNSLNVTLTKDAAAITAQISAVTIALKTQIVALSLSLNTLGQQIVNDLQTLPKQASDFMGRLVSNGDFTAKAYDFTEKVKQVSFGDLMNNVVIDLNTAGQRDLGDRVTIKLALGSSSGISQEKTVLHYSLYFCKAYARTAVGFLFVSPTPLFQRTDDKAFFRYAPSYSILLKGFWKSAEKTRTSLSYHKLYSPGIGLNFSALDFNNDGAVELGIGGVLTLFQDFLQVGYGINTYGGRGYAFFGFKLPVGAFSIH